MTTSYWETVGESLAAVEAYRCTSVQISDDNIAESPGLWEWTSLGALLGNGERALEGAALWELGGEREMEGGMAPSGAGEWHEERREVKTISVKKKPWTR
jgi:hypothetical protein